MADAQKANPSFSQRAFARKLGVASGFLNEVLAGKKNLSSQMALRFASRLDLDPSETEVFCTLVQLESTHENELKQRLIERLKFLKKSDQIPTDLSLEVFAAISDWYHVAIRNLVELDDFKMTPKGVAKRLGISPIEVEIAIERLLKLNLIEKSETSFSGYIRSAQHSWVASHAPNLALRRFHKQMMMKAIESLETQNNKEKIVASHTLPIPDAAFAEADKLVDDFLMKIAKLADLPGKRTQVYHFGVQFFNLTPNPERKKQNET